MGGWFFFDSVVKHCLWKERILRCFLVLTELKFLHNRFILFHLQHNPDDEFSFNHKCNVPASSNNSTFLYELYSTLCHEFDITIIPFDE